MTICNTPPQAHFLTSLAAARNEYACRFGATWGAYIKRFCAVLWGFFALCALAVFHGHIQDSDLMWGYACRELLQPVGFGLLGLMMACLMAALMSTADMLMITGSGLLTRNIYRPLAPERSEAHYVRVGRMLGVVVVVSGAFIATQFDTILQLLKFMWEINIMVAATWWLGMKWRRANRAGAWTSMAFAATCFFLLPVLLPACFPSLRANDYLRKTTQVRSIEHSYCAHEMDVEARKQEIAVWRQLSDEERKTPQPKPLAVGEQFTKTDSLQAKSIFWTKGLSHDAEGTTVGAGMLSLELIALDRMGCDLSANTYAINETVRIAIRTITPFLILMLVSRLTAPEDKVRLDRFFAKMATPVEEDREADARELELSYAEPTRFDHRKLFPRSDWMFYKWNRVDTIGFVLAVLCAFAVIGFLKLLLTLGS
jgi:SSS family solute:Na+ symporter